MNYPPEECFYSLSSSQKLHDLETIKVELVAMVRDDEFLKTGFQYSMKIGLRKLTNEDLSR